MNALEVRCTVSNCYFWKQENYCGADRILVTSDQVDANQGDLNASSIAQLVNEVGETPVNSGRVTCCQTFRPGDRG